MAYFSKSLVNLVPASRTAADETKYRHGRYRYRYSLHLYRTYLLFLSSPCVNIVMYPGDDALKDAFLAGDGDGVAGDELGHLVRAQAVELVALQHLGEVALNVGVRAGHQLQAPVQVGKPGHSVISCQ